ncbi:BTB/POZ domain-containing protein At2g46260-like [Lotus japonicus]|uniref:BTB/POZ domain-containing protein At2g46260-like n=1 Tax=Lotus japonicus TaxID=34305 RepID=UPI002588CC4C|nr:BTB/POZ domain-containing protein At2g46260-like [Lotus japonicus]
MTTNDGGDDDDGQMGIGNSDDKKMKEEKMKIVFGDEYEDEMKMSGVGEGRKRKRREDVRMGFQEELMALPLSGIKAILASDDIQVESEDNVYNFTLNWVRQKYKSQKERGEVLGKELGPLIRFIYMTCQKVKDLLIDFEEEGVSKHILQTLKDMHCKMSRRNHLPVNHFFEARAYKSVMHMSLTREDCITMFPSGHLHSEDFPFGGLIFILSASCRKAEHDSPHGFGFAVGRRKWCKGGSIDADYKFAVMLRPTKKFATLHISNSVFIYGKFKGCKNLFGVPWTSFIAEDSPFFIEGILHLRAKLTIRRCPIDLPI